MAVIVLSVPSEHVPSLLAHITTGSDHIEINCTDCSYEILGRGMSCLEQKMCKESSVS